MPVGRIERLPWSVLTLFHIHCCFESKSARKTTLSLKFDFLLTFQSVAFRFLSEKWHESTICKCRQQRRFPDTHIPLAKLKCCGHYEYLVMKMRMIILMTNIVQLWLAFFMKKMVRRHFVPLTPQIHFVPVTMLLTFCPNCSPEPRDILLHFWRAPSWPYLGHNSAISWPYLEDILVISWAYLAMSWAYCTVLYVRVAAFFTVLNYHFSDTMWNSILLHLGGLMI